MHTSARTAARAGVAALIAGTLSACSSITGTTDPSMSPATGTSAVAPTTGPAAASDDSPAPTTSAMPAAAPTAPTTAAATTGPASTDPNRPAGQCADGHLKVTVQKYGLAADHTIWQFLFIDTGTSACELRGYPGISVVGHGNGTQLGEPLRDRHGEVATVTLQPGESDVNALVSVVDVGSDGGPLGTRCPTTAADGWRIYPPHSTRAVFIPAHGLRACTGDTAWMSVDPVTDNLK